MMKTIFKLCEENNVSIKFEYKSYTDSFRITIERGCLKKEINLSPVLVNDLLDEDFFDVVTPQIIAAIDELNRFTNEYLNKERKV